MPLENIQLIRHFAYFITEAISIRFCPFSIFSYAILSLSSPIPLIHK